MRIMRGKYFEAQDGFWEKIEIELEDDDLTEEELTVPQHLRPQLLELKAELNMIAFLERKGVLSPQEAQRDGLELTTRVKSLFPKKATTANRLKLPDAQ